MPSASKRRKAAKKKKELFPHITTSYSSSSPQQENGYSPKSHDDKDSDSGGDVSSPTTTTTTQEQQNLSRREEEEEEGGVKLEESKDFPSVGFVFGKPHKVVIEESQVGGKEEKIEEFEVTKEVDFESRVVNIDAVKDSEGEVVEEGGKSFGDYSVSSFDEKNEAIEKKNEFQHPTSESDEGANRTQTLSVFDPAEEVVSLTKEVIYDPKKQITSQSEETIQAGEVSAAEKLPNLGKTNLQSHDREEKMLLPSNGTSHETSNGRQHPKEVSSVPPTVRPTSWKSCCGLFDVLVGSNR